MISRCSIKIKPIVGLIVAVFGLYGCATIESRDTDEQVVERRAQERLDALLVWDLDKALSYTTPAFREGITKSQYGSRYTGAANWTKAQVDSVICEEERCNVKYIVTYQMARPRIENDRVLEQTWIQVNNQWYIYER